MKYGIISYKKTVRPGGIKWTNLGDPIQSYAMVKIYEEMGIPESELVKVNRYSSKSYDGDYVILPFNCYNMIFDQYRHNNSLPVSDKIIPVFVSFHLHSRVLEPDLLQQLRTYEPIGCRDEETMKMLRSYNIRAYLSGCVTATLPKRKANPQSGKNYFVDCPESLLEYIPQNIMVNAEFVTHMPYIPRSSEDIYLTDEEEQNYYQLGVNQLKLYENDANLVVTSRLHVAAPCMALGIPVILVSENFDGRFSWIDKYLPLYTPSDFGEINWNPDPIDYEEDKEIIKRQFIYRIQKAFEENHLLYDCSSLLEDRKRSVYNKEVINSLKQIASNTESVKYAIWGMRAETMNLHHVISDHFPNWKLSAVIDEYCMGEYEGYPILTSKDIPDLDDDEIVYFIVPEAAHDFASDFFKGKKIRGFLVKNKTEFVEI
ncbi:polysaccharide pyruvyl transferase family protein [Paenibacillus solani]|uniref:polysaccharide pyruvyl transferase family protein n=1 Tax=Paenibacillus solani TaxID=1705565 RepID=UPI003D26D75D